MKNVAVYDTTLRDGAQAEGISFSGGGKIRLATRLDAFGVDYIEGGWPGANPKDMAFFQDIRDVELKHAKVTAFGSTRRARSRAADDPNVNQLLEAATPVVTIFGKSWRLHVTDVLRTTEEENRAMIADTVSYLKEAGREVIYDAEHFFDGYKDDPEFAMATVVAARDAGADIVVLCDTNGGCLPHEVGEITRTVSAELATPLGIHTHNDGGVAAANAIEAVRAGAVHIQGTINGFGERNGNLNLCTVIPALQLKLGCDVVPAETLKEIRDLSMFVSELTGRRPDPTAPYIGASSFAHKGGMHVNAVEKNPRTFEHITPEAVGNTRRILISEVSGSSSVLMKAIEMGVNMDRKSPEVRSILQELKRLESTGYAYEAAEASFKLLIQKVLKQHRSFFDQHGYKVFIVHDPGQEPRSEATVKVSVDGSEEYTVGEGDGPINALDNALRKALTRFYPEIARVVLTDYRVNILDPQEATAAKTRVQIESTDGEETWGTVGVSENLIEASWEALVDSVEYKLFRDEERRGDAPA